MLKFFYDIITDPLFGIVWALIGFFIGNRFNIARAKRNEFNDLINPIRRELIGVRNNHRYHLTGNWAITLTLVSEKLPFWKRKAFSSAVENYKKSKSSDNINMNVDGMGDWSYKDSEWIIHCVNDLLKYIKPK